MNTPNKPDFLLAGIPILADTLAWLLSTFLLPALISQMRVQSSLNVLLLVLFYGLLCVGVILIRKLEPGRPSHRFPPFLLARPTRMILGILFGIAMMLAISYQLNFLDAILETDASVLDEGESAAFFVFAPGAWLGISLLYALFISFAVTPTIPKGSSRYPWLALAGLLGVNGMLLMVTALGKAIAQQVSAGPTVAWFLATYALLLLLLGPPRLLYLKKQPYPNALVTFLVLLGYCAWQILV